MTDTWTATLTADEWTTTVTAEAWTSNDYPGVEFVTQVVHSGAVTAGGTGDGAATVDAVALTNFTVSTLTLSALNASISSTVAVNDTVLIPGGADAGTYTVTQSGAPCLTIIDPQPTTVRVNDVSSGSVWYVLVGTVWVPHATVQQLAAATGEALGHTISAFIKVAYAYGNPLDTPVIVHQDDPPVYIASFSDSDGYEYAGLYDGHSPDYATPALLTLSARQPIIGDIYFTRGFYDITGFTPLPPPLETDVVTFRCGYISQNNGLNLPVQTLFIEKEQDGGIITNDASMIKIDDPSALGLDPASTDVSLALEELAAGGGGGGSGDVVGPASSTADRPALFDGTTGKLLKQASAALGTAAFTASSDYATAAQGTDSRTPTGGAGGALSGTYPNPGLNDETVQDMVGAMFSGNTETGIAATYDDTNGKVDLAVGIGSSVQAYSSVLASLAAKSSLASTTVYLGAQSGVTLNASPASLASFTIPALGANDSLEFEFWWTIFNNSGGTRAYTLALKLGSTTIATAAGTASVTAPNTFQLNAKGLVYCTAAATQWGTFNPRNVGATIAGGQGTAAETVSGGTTLDLMVTSAAATATQTGTFLGGLVKVLRA